MADMSLKEIEAWLETEIEHLDAEIAALVIDGYLEFKIQLHLARARLVAKLADARITNATTH